MLQKNWENENLMFKPVWWLTGLGGVDKIYLKWTQDIRRWKILQFNMSEATWNLLHYWILHQKLFCCSTFTFLHKKNNKCQHQLVLYSLYLPVQYWRSAFIDLNCHKLSSWKRVNFNFTVSLCLELTISIYVGVKLETQ